MSRYAIWDKASPVITPSGEVFTAEQWMARYPVAALEHIKVVCSAGELNGAFFGTLGSMREMYEAMGADFSGCETDEELLSAIERFEQNPPAAEEGEPSAQERIAAALEYQNLLSM